MQVRRDQRWRRLPDAMRELDGWTAVVNTEPSFGKRLFVHARVEIRKAVTELDVATIHRDRSECRLDARLCGERQVGDITGQKPADARAFELQVSRHPALIAQMHLAADNAAEQPDQ